MALDDVDAALSDYEPTDTEGDVQDENVQMQNAPTQAVDAETPDQGVSNGELDRISGAVAPTPTMPADQLGNPNPMQAANQAFDAGKATAAAQGGVGTALGEKEQFMAQEAQDREVQARLDEQERADQAAAQHEALEKTHAETEAAAKKYDEFKFHDHWKEAPVGHKVLAMLFSGLGGAAAARTGGPNEALRAMDDISQREYNQDVQRLNKAETFMKWKKEGETNLQSRFEKEKANLQMQQAARLKSMADLAESHYLRTHPGATVDEAKNNVIVAGLTQKAAETYSGAVQNIYKIEAAKQAALLKAKKAGAGGGNMGALKQFTDRANELKPGEPIPADLMELGRRAGYKLNQITPEIDRLRNTGSKSEGGERAEKKLSAADEARTVVFEGKRYLAPTSRIVDKVDQRLINYGDAEESLRDLLAYHKSDPLKAKLPLGDRYDRAVLAVATVTTANASDKTTTHEANTIKNFGLSSPDAIQRTLDHVKQRKQAFISTLKPVDDEPSPTKADKPKIPTDVIERAKARAASGDKKAKDWLAGHGL